MSDLLRTMEFNRLVFRMNEPHDLNVGIPPLMALLDINPDDLPFDRSTRGQKQFR